MMNIHTAEAIRALKTIPNLALSFDNDSYMQATLATTGYPLIRRIAYTRRDTSLVSKADLHYAMISFREKVEREAR